MTVRLILGDALTEMRKLPNESVHCVVTSPPYYNLRDYGTASWEGGDPACDHLGEPFRTSAKINENWDGGNDVKNATKRQPFKDACGKCGATRKDKQIGLEPTPAEFVAVMVEVFREVRRVLRKDGTLWLNLGDSYAGAHETGRRDTQQGRYIDGRAVTSKPGEIRQQSRQEGVAPKNLLGIPWRVAFALQADGWYLRQDIIWSKPNPMPESVTDRCTKAHEYLFLLSKSARYFYDGDAIREPHTGPPVEHYGTATVGEERALPAGVRGSIVTAKPREYHPDGRNRRSVWTVATQPFAQAHFATFPPDLIEPCILAGCPKGGTVLDPFGGAGTTGLVADRLQRDAILIELNPDYAAMAESRIVGDAPLFVEMNAGWR